MGSRGHVVIVANRHGTDSRMASRAGTRRLVLHELTRLIGVDTDRRGRQTKGNLRPTPMSMPQTEANKERALAVPERCLFIEIRPGVSKWRISDLGKTPDFSPRGAPKRMLTRSMRRRSRTRNSLRIASGRDRGAALRRAILQVGFVSGPVLNLSTARLI
jgi:hypothetical protein